MAMTDFEKRIQRAFEGNERVYFNTDAEVAVWYGGPTISVYNAHTWKETRSITVSAGFTDVSVRALESAVENRMALQGFDRTGRSGDSTLLVEGDN